MYLFPPKERAASSSLLLISPSSSSSVRRVTGFLEPPISAFLLASRKIISRMAFLCLLPGWHSMYCFISRLENPLVPPKYPMTDSSSSAVCGILEPPVLDSDRKVSTALVSRRFKPF